ncbi:ABC transporter permease [bacterium DOLZORAL124_64_63]|nr:MAG: ABC transporter permease [bacterium DOLZORAL124_64_63]
MRALIHIARDFPRYLWSGWGPLASIFLLFALWDLGHQVYGDLVLASPLDSLDRLRDFLCTSDGWVQLRITTLRGLYGFGIAALIGSVLGGLAGLFVTASMMSRPIMTILTGMPPIAWIVLAMIWFGLGNGTVVFTVVVSSVPIVFLGAMQGTRTLENHIKEMADSFQTPRLMKFTDVYFPHMFSHLFPAWVSALGMSWKIVVMAELLTTSDGMGASLAVARSHLDSAGALALVLALVGLLLVFEYLLLEPVKREVEQWRE